MPVLTNVLSQISYDLQPRGSALSPTCFVTPLRCAYRTPGSLAELPDHPHIQHEHVETTQVYLQADLAIKEHALARIKPRAKPARYRPSDTSSWPARPGQAAGLGGAGADWEQCPGQSTGRRLWPKWRFDVPRPRDLAAGACPGRRAFSAHRAVASPSSPGVLSGTMYQIVGEVGGGRRGSSV